MSDSLQEIINLRTAHAQVLKNMAKVAKSEEEQSAIICGYVLIEMSINKIKEMIDNGYSKT